MKCVNHPDRDATEQCSLCKDLLCDDCKVKYGVDKYICKSCSEKITPHTPIESNQSEPNSNKSNGGLGCVVFALAAACILLLPTISGMLDKGRAINSYKPSDTTLSSSSKTYTTTKSYETEDPLAGLDYYGPNTYKVGIDIPPGEYMIVQYYEDRNGYMCVSSDSNGNDIIDNAIIKNYHFIKVSSGQYLEISNAIAVSAENYKIPNINTAQLKEGMYRVGVDIPGGEYKVTATSSSASGYYAIYNTASADRDIEDNDIFETSSYVTVRDGQYLELNNCTASLVN